MPENAHRSRAGWADSMESEPAGAISNAHAHRLPKSVRTALIGLAAVSFLLLVAVGFLTVYVYQADQYVQGRGAFRDAEAARAEAKSEERIRRAMCDLLDTLPEGGLLENPRGKYGCGPGMPLSELPPEQAEQLRTQRTPTAPSAQAVAPGPSSTPAPAPSAGAAAPSPAPQTPAPSTAPDRPSAVDLGPLTDPSCESVRICF